jgi:hypothetical protein
MEDSNPMVNAAVSNIHIDIFFLIIPSIFLGRCPLYLPGVKQAIPFQKSDFIQLNSHAAIPALMNPTPGNVRVVIPEYVFHYISEITVKLAISRHF